MDLKKDRSNYEKTLNEYTRSVQRQINNRLKKIFN